jgi:hypothetical protein
MATKKPKTKRMALGGMAAGVASRILNPVQNATKAPPVKSGLTAIGPRKNAASMAADARAARGATKQVPNYAQPYVARQTPDYARPYTSAQKPPSSGQMPSQLASVARAYNAQKSGTTGTGPQRVMKKGGTVKKKVVKK